MTPETVSTSNKGAGVRATSLEAFHSLDLHKVAGLRRRIAEHLAVVGRSSTRLMSEALTLDLQGISPRLAEMKRMGIVETDGRLVNATGKAALAWRLTENGALWLRGEWMPPEDPKAGSAKRNARARFERALQAVLATKDTRDDKVLVPMGLMVELHVAERRLREVLAGHD
ncbi:MAG: hypothetical protein ABR586_09500 [Thermoplasmatota archaeon]